MTAVNKTARRVEAMRYPKGIHIIFNSKVYTNRENLKQWACQQYKWYSTFLPSDNEPRLLVLNAFSVYKKSADKVRSQGDFIAELKKLNTTVSIVPPGGTGYVQMCDGFTNKKIKELISELEEIHYDQNEAE